MTRSAWTILPFLVMAGITAGLSARADDDVPASIAQTCHDTANARPPQSDLPTAQQKRALTDCDSEALYFGIGLPADPAKARLCAFVEQTEETDVNPHGYYGSHMLMMVYANGKGAARDLPYALHLACTRSWAPAEAEARVAHLQGTRQPWYKQDFDFCDDATSGQTGGFCEAHQARFQQEKTKRVIAAFRARLPVSARAIFQVLTEAQAKWAAERADNEIDQSGTLRSAFVIHEEELQNQDFADMLTRLQGGHPPPLGQKERTAADNRIRHALKQLAAPGMLADAGTVTWGKIEQAQAAWTLYRDAWGRFAQIAYPTWGPVGAEAWVTMKRADMLAHLLPHDPPR
ncbi:hypothetical protein ACMAUO_03885 [Gluconacetobacter sp. Hr-1-5]|uniref:hypothetical protein n=1 Tax=Gluconacetobacter sp. Hr-1-5 TaxID=3395370 RepID=UPI003B52B563